MRKFTKSLMTLALLCIAGVTSAATFNLRIAAWGDGMQADNVEYQKTDSWTTLTVELGTSPITTTDNVNLRFVNTTFDVNFLVQKVEIYENDATSPFFTVDYTTEKPAYYHETGWATNGSSPIYENGARVIPADTYAHCFIADWFNVTEGNTYKAVITYKTQTPVVINWVNITKNSDLETNENNHFTVTEQGVGGPFIANIQAGIGKDGSRGIAVQSSDSPTQEWDTQFFISAPKKLPSGKKFKVSFDYKASQAAEGHTQWHNAPGSYVWWGCIGNVNFTTGWQTFEKIFTVTQSEDNGEKKDIAPYTIAFNLAVEKTATTYYFDNIKIEIPEEDVATLEDAPALTNETYPCVTIGEAGYVTFSHTSSLVFGDDVEAYAAVYNAGGYVELTKLDGVAKKTAVILKAASGDYTAKVKDDVAEPAANDLKVSDGTVAGDGTIYVLAKGTKGVGFYKLASGEKVPSGKAYFQIPASAREFIGFGDATSIETVKTAKAEEGIFNLQGQRLMKAQKGLNIINGKKFLVK